MRKFCGSPLGGSVAINDVNRHFQFGPFLLDSRERQLSREGEPIRLTPKAFDVLLVLVSRAGHLVTKEELLKEVWPDTFVEEGNLSYTVSLLRKALEVEPGTDTYIATVQKLGYRFTAPSVPPKSPAKPCPVQATSPSSRRTSRWNQSSMLRPG